LVRPASPYPHPGRPKIAEATKEKKKKGRFQGDFRQTISRRVWTASPSQPVDLSRPHPFTAAGNRKFNTCLWMPPGGKRGGHILLVDSTNFTTLFGGTESLARFWNNMAKM
jgi:hypothetical protein